MFLVLLPPSSNRSRAPEHLDAHKAWIHRGLDDGVFLLVGGLKPQGGGLILAQGVSREDLERRIADDPFVRADVVSFELTEVTPTFASERLMFLLE